MLFCRRKFWDYHLRCWDSIIRYSKKVKILDLKMKVWKSHMLGVTLFHRIHGICIFTITRLWFQIIFYFNPKIGQDFQFDSYFSDGLTPATRDAELGKTPLFWSFNAIIPLNKSHLHEIDMVGMISLTHFGCLLISGFFKCSWDCTLKNKGIHTTNDWRCSLVVAYMNSGYPLKYQAQPSIFRGILDEEHSKLQLLLYIYPTDWCFFLLTIR